jgi:hypothetical protein
MTDNFFTPYRYDHADNLSVRESRTLRHVVRYADNPSSWMEITDRPSQGRVLGACGHAPTMPK